VVANGKGARSVSEMTSGPEKPGKKKVTPERIDKETLGRREESQAKLCEEPKEAGKCPTRKTVGDLSPDNSVPRQEQTKHS